MRHPRMSHEYTNNRARQACMRGQGVDGLRRLSLGRSAGGLAIEHLFYEAIIS